MPEQFVSYAQNFEDVVLWRAFADQDGGVYVDVGAADPEVDSVTKAFYERGWSGINIEPNGELYDRLAAARPRDVNLNVGLSDVDGTLDFYRALHGDWGISTFDAALVARHEEKGFRFEKTEVPVLRLDDILSNLRPGSVDVLKVDVEGYERQVLLGAALGVHRPKVVIVESTAPLSTVRTDEHWAGILLAAGYRSALFDGLNCFFVRDDLEELATTIAAPANVLDNFVPHRFLADAAAADRCTGDCRTTPAPPPPQTFVADVEGDDAAPEVLDGCRSVGVLFSEDLSGHAADDVLRSYVDAFDAADDVTLVVWATGAPDDEAAAWSARLQEVTTGRSADDLPDILLVPAPLSGESGSMLLASARAAVTGATGPWREAVHAAGRAGLDDLSAAGWRRCYRGVLAGRPSPSTTAGQPASPAPVLPHSKVREPDDLSNPDLVAWARLVLPDDGPTAGDGDAGPGRWAAAMAVRALAAAGAVRRDAELLALGTDNEAARWLGDHAGRVLTAEPGSGDLCHDDERFDAVVAIHSLDRPCHRRDLQLAVTEVHRVLKPGGMFSLAVTLGAEPAAGEVPGGPLLAVDDLDALFPALRWSVIGFEGDTPDGPGRPVAALLPALQQEGPHLAGPASGTRPGTNVHLALRKLR